MFDFLKRYTTIVRRDTKIVLPRTVYKALKAKGIDISLVKSKGKPSCVQLTSYDEGKQIYHGTLKAYMKVKSFKDGNICNFRTNNIIKK